MVLRCTAKLLRTLRTQPAVGVPAGADDWYANLVWVSGRKCLLVAHALTMFCAFVPDVRITELRAPGRYVATLIQRELMAEGLVRNRLGPLDPDSVVIARTVDRQVLGNMNDFVRQAAFAIEDAGGLGRCDIAALNRSLRRMPFGRGGRFTSAAEMLSLARLR
jgi:hypothetical protein